MSLQMHELIQSMAREIIREEFNMHGNRSRLWISSAFYDALNKSKVTKEVEVLVLLLKNYGQNIPIDGKAFTRMKNLRILKIYFQEHWRPFAVKFSGSLDFLSNELRLFCWHGCPFKYLPSDFYPENIVAIDLSYSHIKQLWTTPKRFRRLKAMKLRYCCNLTTTPDFSEIINLEELSLEGCVNLVSVHPSIGMLKWLVVLNLRDCKRLQNFPSRVEMDSLQVLNLTGCLKVNKLPEDLGKIKSLTEIHVDRTAITEFPLFVSSLINLESLSFGGQGTIQPRWWTCSFGLLSKQQHSQRSSLMNLESLAGLHMLKSLNLSYCNLLEVPESIGGLSCLERLYLEGNNFTSLPGSLSQLSHLQQLSVDGCKKLEVLPEIPPSVWNINASDCTSLREVSVSSKDPFSKRLNAFSNCPKLFKNVTIDSEGSITSQGSIHQLSFLRNLGFPTNREFFLLYDSFLDIVYHGNNIPDWFTNRSSENLVKVELPSESCFNKLRGFGTCVVFKRKKPCRYIEYYVENFDVEKKELQILTSRYEFQELKKDESYMIWLHYTSDITEWEEAKNFVTLCFQDEEDIEVKECGARLICDGDLQQDVTNLSMFQDLPPISQHGGAISYRSGPYGGSSFWSW